MFSGVYIYIYIYIPLKTPDIFRRLGTLRINGLKAFAYDMINLFYYEH